MIKILWYSFDDEDFDYEVDKYDLEDKLRKYLKEYDRDELVDLLLEDEHILDVLADYFDEKLQYDFEKEALEQYNDMIEEEKDPLGVRGLSLKDFL